MVLFPQAKINLGLYVLAKRPDSYHEILTSFFPIPWSDVLEISEHERFEMLTTGLDVEGDPTDNLCAKAYLLLKQDYKLPTLKLHLHKIIPMGAGLGGGSSDAAAVLRGVNDFCNLGLSDTVLETYAARLGSDCAFFVRSVPCIASGRGEVLEETKIDLKGNTLLVVYPNIHVSTATAYAGVMPKMFEADLKELLANKSRWKNELKNQFEETVFPHYPTLSQIKDRLYSMGAWYACMSGSGSAMFGLFSEDVDPQLFSGYRTFKTVL